MNGLILLTIVVIVSGLALWFPPSFWRVRRQRDEARAELCRMSVRSDDWERKWNEVRKSEKALAYDVEHLRKDLEDTRTLREIDAALLKGRLAAMLPRIALPSGSREQANVERILTLASLGENDPVWLAIVSWADEHEQNEFEEMLGAHTPSEIRHYNAGAAASARKFANFLRDVRTQASRELARRAKQAEKK